MELNQESLLVVFGETAELCAGSIVLVVDGVKQEVATANLHTGAYTLSKAGEALVKAHVEDTAPTSKPATKGKGVKNTPIESLPLPGVPALDAEIEKALVGLEFAEE